MTTVLLFHHAQGQTAGFLAFAEELRGAGHTIHAPDLYDGNTFADLNEGVAFAQHVGFGRSSVGAPRRPSRCPPTSSTRPLNERTLSFLRRVG